MSFFNNLTHIISEKYFAKIPMNSTLADSQERWFNHLAKLKNEVLLDSEFWLNYWTDNPCMTKPTPEDALKLKHTPEELERFKYTYESACTDLHIALCTSLEALIEADRENLESTENLHQWHLMLKREMISRGYEGMTEQDSFYIDVEKKRKGLLISMDKARLEGICPFCNSKANVISYGEKWHCKACKKYWRKA
ncbi:MAG: hypothetical protein ACE14S_06890 [Candidatus Bathyarchaeia archaeon]